MGIGTKLAELLTLRNKKPGTLASETGINKNTIYAIIKRDSTRVNMSTLESIAQNLGVSVDYFFDSKYDRKPLAAYPDLTPIDQMPRHRVPLIGTVAAGTPIIADAQYDIYVDSPAQADYALTIQGDSMEPLYLNGDVVYIKEQPDVDDGRIAVVLMDDSATLKRIYHTSTGLLLVSENTSYPPINATFDEYNVIRILGVVTGYTRMYKRP